MTKTEEAPQEEAKPINEWGDDFDKSELTIPYKREEPTEDVDEPEEEVEEDEELPEAPELQSIVTAEDPGEFTPEDYSFDYQIDGKTYKIATADDIDKIPDEDMEKLSAKDITVLLRRATSIDTKVERDREKYEAQKKEFDEQTEEQQQQIQTINTFAAEFDYLVSKGFLPKVPKELQEADWTDAEISKREGVKEQKEILDYMVKENRSRSKLGLKPLNSIIDTFNALAMEKNRSTSAEREKSAKEARKSAGARVAGPTNSPMGTTAPKGIAVGRTNVFRNANIDWS